MISQPLRCSFPKGELFFFIFIYTIYIFLFSPPSVRARPSRCFEKFIPLVVSSRSRDTALVRLLLFLAPFWPSYKIGKLSARADKKEMRKFIWSADSAGGSSFCPYRRRRRVFWHGSGFGEGLKFCERNFIGIRCNCIF